MWLPEESLRLRGKPYFAPGRGYHYSNTNYLVLGMLAEAVGGAPIAEQLHARFLDPLGLKSTATRAPSRRPRRRPTATSSRARPEASRDRPDRQLLDRAVPVGRDRGRGERARSPRPPTDLVHWARALYGGDALSEPSLRAMLGDIARTSVYGHGVAYGLGVQSVLLEGRPTYGHSGRLLGSQAVMRWLPTESMSIAVLTNQSRADPRRSPARCSRSP